MLRGAGPSVTRLGLWPLEEVAFADAEDCGRVACGAVFVEFWRPRADGCLVIVIVTSAGD